MTAWWLLMTRWHSVDINKHWKTESLTKWKLSSPQSPVIMLKAFNPCKWKFVICPDLFPLSPLLLLLLLLHQSLLTSSQPGRPWWERTRTGCPARTRCPPRSCRCRDTRGWSSSPSSGPAVWPGCCRRAGSPPWRLEGRKWWNINRSSCLA